MKLHHLLLILLTSNILLSQNSIETHVFESNKASELTNFGESSAVSNDRVIVGKRKSYFNGYRSGQVYLYEKVGSAWIESDLNSSNINHGDEYGASLDIKGDRIVIGAPMDDDAASNAGCIYIFEWDGTSWIEQIIIASDAQVGDRFGSSVRLDGDRIIVGASFDDDNGSNAGSVYIFDWDGSTWNETKILASDGTAGDRFGFSVDIYGDRAIVGAPEDDGSEANTGTAYIYEYDGSIWNETKLQESFGDTGDAFGHDVSIYDDNIVVGIPDDEGHGTDSGSMVIYNWDGVNWFGTKYQPTDGAAMIRRNFGFSLSLGPDRLVVGAYRDNDNGPASGSVYVYRQNSVGNWIYNKVLPSDGNAQDRYGYSVSIDSSRFVSGAYYDDVPYEDSGSAYIFDRTGITSWSEEKISPSVVFNNNWFGASVDQDGLDIVIGARDGVDSNNTAMGSVFVELFDGSDWIEHELTPSDGAIFDLFGYDVAIENNIVVVGAPCENENGVKSGSIYIYEWDGSTWSETKIANPNSVVSQRFGYAVEIMGDKILAGAPFRNRGVVHLFEKIGGHFQLTNSFSNAGTENFGISIDSDIDKFIVGDSFFGGSAYLYESNGNTWQQTVFEPSDNPPNNRYGSSVAVYDNKVIIGNPYDDDNGTDAGAAYAYVKTNGQWLETKLLSSGGSSDDYFGTSVEVNNNIFLVGSPTKNGNGQVFKYNIDCDEIGPENIITASTSESFLRFGTALAQSDTTFVVGTESGFGRAFLFEYTPPSSISCGFSSTWQTTTANETITIPTTGGGYNYSINWGDGSPTETNIIGDITHQFASPGQYTIQISGDFPRIYFNNSGDKDKILTINSWGAINWSSMLNAFKGCSNLTVLAEDSPDLSSVTNMISMFRDCSSFNSDINHWDVSNVRRMDFLFKDAASYNKPLDNWNTGSVLNMQSMFENCTSFNQPLNNWQTSSVTNMSKMFKGANTFDQDLTSWNFSSVETMFEMFENAGLSSNLYDILLGYWSCNGSIQNNVVFGGGNSQYCVSNSARTSLISNNNWIITDSGQNTTCSSNLPSIEWQGEISSEWYNCLNWKPQIIPTFQDNALIPPSNYFYPFVPLGTFITINKLEIEANAEFEIEIGAILNTLGNN